MITARIDGELEVSPRTYKVFILRGILAVLFGLFIFLMPGMALLTLVFLFGIYAIADGVFNLVAAVPRTGTRRKPRWVLVVHGVLGIIAGLPAFFMPGLTALAMLYLIAAWAVATGALQIVSAIRLRKQITGEWLLAISGALSIVFGVLVALFPDAGALAVILWIGAYAVVVGVLLIALGFRIRRWLRTDHHAHGFPTAAPSH